MNDSQAIYLILVFWVYFVSMRALVCEFRTHTTQAERYDLQTAPLMLAVTLVFLAHLKLWYQFLLPTL